MTDEKETLRKNEIGELSNELTYRNYLMNKNRVRDLFKRITIPEYIALHTIQSESVSSEAEQKETDGDGTERVVYNTCAGRIYLRNLAEKMQMQIRQASKMVGNLQDKGLILWSHDGKGSEGTYVTITETGQESLAEQEAILKNFYGKVIERFGKQNLVNLLQLMKQLEGVMSSEIEEMELPDDHEIECAG